MRPKIIGALVGLGLLFSQAPSAFAIYSPILSKEATRIRQDVFASRQQNGMGSWLNAVEKIEKNNKELQEQGEASGISGTFPLFSDLAKKIAIQALTESFLDGFKLLIPAASGISVCLRDDIWELQALQEEVLNEMFKASLLSDLTNSQKLYGDYQQLQTWIDGDGKSDKVPGIGIQKGWKRDGWFPDQKNYYVDCPYGSITMAIEDAKVSLTRLVETFSGGGFQMGSINDMWNIAKKRSIQKAAAYIAQNQIKISFGGEAGANPEGLINGSGIAGLSGSLETAYKTAKDALGVFRYTGGGGNRTSLDVATANQDAFDKYTLASDRIYTSLAMGIQLDAVSEESLKDIEGAMVKINSKILEASNQNSIPDICEKMNAILKKHCPNKAANEPFNCKK